MRYFQPDEFKDFPAMHPSLLALLDDVRDRAGVPFKLKSDYRTAESNAAAGGSPTSLHLLGLAVDFTLTEWTPVALFKIAAACAPHLTGIELEIDMTNLHIHLGHFLDARPSRLVVKR